MDRRRFLRWAGSGAAAAALGPVIRSVYGGTTAEAQAAETLWGGSVLDLPANECPIDTVVIFMMENRSFDHFFGWLATDEQFIEDGRTLYGPSFHIDGDQRSSYVDPSGQVVDTFYLPTAPGEAHPYRGCDHPDPGHGWESGRIQRDDGFLAEGSQNDPYAIGYYAANDVPFYADLARRFTTFDRYHCSLLAPTYPNREYLHSAQSGGIKGNHLPFGTDELGFQWETIWDRFAANGVRAGYYFVDLPTIGLWGPRLIPYARHIESFFVDAALGMLPNVVFVDPGFTTGLRTDDHPHADIRAGQNLVFNVFKAFASSPNWNRGAFFLTYDEWGGFFDHVAPPSVPDDRASSNDDENFGQLGFRVPTVMASPYARRGYVDHRLYDHTSILRFLEWRFLGAPPEGSGGDSRWYLTTRDRTANNIGLSLRPIVPQPEVDLDLLPRLPVTSLPCDGELLVGIDDVTDVATDQIEDQLGIDVPLPGTAQKHSFELDHEAGFFERMGYEIELKPLPV